MIFSRGKNSKTQTPKAEFCFKVSSRTNHIVNKRYFKEWYAFSMPSALKKLCCLGMAIPV